MGLTVRWLLIAGLLTFQLIIPFAAVAQTGKVYRIGALTSSWGPTPGIVGLRDGLEQLGYQENKDFFIGVRFTRGDSAALAAAARELVGYGIDLIYAASENAATAARGATDRVPIVCNCDPVRAGLAHSFARPGTNVTGVTDQDLELTPKRLRLLQELVPGIQRVLFVYAADDRQAKGAAQAYRDTARQLGIGLVVIEVRTQEEARAALDVERGSLDGILAPSLPSLNIPGFVLETASRQLLPAMFPGGRFWVERGALISYGPTWFENGRLAARLVDKILKGADPAVIPVETNPRVGLAINLKTAKILGLTIPPSVLVRAGEVIN